MVSYTEKFSAMTPAGTSWQDYDIYTNLGVPKNAVCQILLLNGSGSATAGMGVRTKGSSLDRYITMHEAESGGYSSFALDVQVDSNGLIQTYCSTTNSINFYLLGYFTGVTFTELHQDINVSGTQNAWNSVNLTGVVPANSVAQFNCFNSTTTYYCNLGVRTSGSVLVRKIQLHEAEGGGWTSWMTYAKANQNSLVEALIQYFDDPRQRFIYVEGYYNTDLDYAELWTNEALSSTGFQDVDLTSILDQDGRVVTVFCGHNDQAAEHNIGVRGKDNTTDNRYWLEQEVEGTSGEVDGETVSAKSDASGIISLYCDSADYDYFYVTGYFKFTGDVVTAVPITISDGLTFIRYNR